MKSTIIKQFEPIKLVITIETEREREFLLAYFNASPVSKVEHANKNLFNGIKEFNTNENVSNAVFCIFYTIKSTL